MATLTLPGLSLHADPDPPCVPPPPQSDDIVTTGFKWLRAVAPSEFTGVHTDRVFLGRGSGQLITAWLPLGDCPTDQVRRKSCPQLADPLATHALSSSEDVPP